MSIWFPCVYGATAKVCMAATFRAGCDQNEGSEMFRRNENCKMLNRHPPQHKHNTHTHIMYTDIRGCPFQESSVRRPASSEGCKQFWWPGVHRWLPWQPEGRGGPVCGRSCAGAGLSLWGWSSEAGRQTKVRLVFHLKAL